MSTSYAKLAAGIDAAGKKYAAEAVAELLRAHPDLTATEVLRLLQEAAAQAEDKRRSFDSAS